jgi:SAM-dependent methyltransferase
MSQPYHSLEAELHDAFWDAEDEGSELALMTDFLKKHPGPALEIGSGSGRLMFPLLQQGFDLEGLELSADMRALGVIRANRLGVDAVVHPGDMTDWQPSRRYSALLATAFTLQLAADPGAVLRHWHTWLEDHGGLYLTVFMPLAELSGDLPEHSWYPDHEAILPDGRQGLLETRHRIDHDSRMIHRQHRYSLTACSRSIRTSPTSSPTPHAGLLSRLEATATITAAAPGPRQSDRRTHRLLRRLCHALRHRPLHRHRRLRQRHPRRASPPPSATKSPSSTSPRPSRKANPSGRTTSAA